jgi:hypothetical protein
VVYTYFFCFAPPFLLLKKVEQNIISLSFSYKVVIFAPLFLKVEKVEKVETVDLEAIQPHKIQMFTALFKEIV